MTFRSICIAVYVFFYLIFTTPMRARLKKLEKTDPQEASRIAQEQVQKVFKHLLKISGVTIEVNGLENIPDEASLFVGNHSSYFDIIVTGATIPGGVGFVAKDSLGKIPGLSSWMKHIHCLFLDRSDVRKGLQTILEGVDYLKEGYSMCIYPEGTRSTTGELGEFKGGSLKMAQRAKAPHFTDDIDSVQGQVPLLSLYLGRQGGVGDLRIKHRGVHPLIQEIHGPLPVRS